MRALSDRVVSFGDRSEVVPKLPCVMRRQEGEEETTMTAFEVGQYEQMRVAGWYPVESEPVAYRPGYFGQRDMAGRRFDGRNDDDGGKAA